ncbi:cation transporter [Candidatus Woesearchaeota archaeon]|nr:cation transporter [Candidatus Woesearchaeota archaeon]
MTAIRIMTKGMHCTSCEMLVKDALGDVDGVNEVQVSHKKGIVYVDFDKNKVKEGTIKEIIKKEGYKIQ